MNEKLRNRIQANLFPAAMPAVEPWDEFPWHLDDRTGECDTWKPHSSQSLAIDVFGTLKAAGQPLRDRVFDALCDKLRVPAGGPWQVHLEWCDPSNLLNETRPTQVDAVAEGRYSLIFFEVKFTERSAGCCSQPRRLKGGPQRGNAQCTGKYELQTNPANAISARCALSGKGIRYWDHIPKLFQLDAGMDHEPCPFAGENYQWMRNVVLCTAAAEARNLCPAFAIAYINNAALPIAAYLQSAAWRAFLTALRPEVPLPLNLELLEFSAMADEANPTGLRMWLESKLRIALCGR